MYLVLKLNIEQVGLPTKIKLKKNQACCAFFQKKYPAFNCLSYSRHFYRLRKQLNRQTDRQAQYIYI